MARSAMASAASASAGRWTSKVTGSAVGPSISRTISSPLWAVAGQCTQRRWSPGGTGARRGARRSARAESGRRRRSCRRARRQGEGPTQAGPDMQGTGEVDHDGLAPPQRPKGAAVDSSSTTGSKTPRTGGGAVTGPARRPARRGPGVLRADEGLGAGGSSGWTRSRVPAAHQLEGEARRWRRSGFSTTATAARAGTTAGATQAHPEDAGEHVAHGLDPARAAVVGHEPPRQEHAGATHERDHGAHGTDEAVPAGGVADRVARPARPVTAGAQVWCRAEPGPRRHPARHLRR